MYSFSSSSDLVSTKTPFVRYFPFVFECARAQRGYFFVMLHGDRFASKKPLNDAWTMQLAKRASDAPSMLQFQLKIFFRSSAMCVEKRRHVVKNRKNRMETIENHLEFAQSACTLHILRCWWCNASAEGISYAEIAQNPMQDRPMGSVRVPSSLFFAIAPFM